MNTHSNDPWGIVNGLARDIDRIVHGSRAFNDRQAFQPATDVREFKDRYELIIDVPGVDPEALDITLHEGILSLSGARAEAPADDGRPSTIERRTGTFSRRFRLPDTVSADGLTADYQHGVLTVTVPKRSRPEPLRVEVKAH